MGALHLDKRGSLLAWEQAIWQNMREQLAQQLPISKQGHLQNRVLQQGNSSDLDLFEQANADVKVSTFMQEADEKKRGGDALRMRVAVAVVLSGMEAVQDLCEAEDLTQFVGRCLRQQNADFLIMLHRHSAQNSQRAISFFFIRATQMISFGTCRKLTISC